MSELKVKRGNQASRPSPVVFDSIRDYPARFGDDGVWSPYALRVNDSVFNLDSTAALHYLRPDIYDNIITLISPTGCSDNHEVSNISSCSFRRGQTHNSTFRHPELPKESVPYADQYRQIINKSFWRLIHGYQNQSGETKAAITDVWDSQASAFRLKDQLVRITSEIDPFVGTIGLSVAKTSLVAPYTSFLEHMKQQFTLPSLSWSYTEAKPLIS